MELKELLSVMLKLKGEEAKPLRERSMWLAYCTESRDEQKIITPKFVVEKFGDSVAIILNEDVSDKYIKQVFRKILG